MSHSLLACLWVSAHHHLRSVPFDVKDAAPWPRLAYYGRLWDHVHDVTKELGHPVAPSKWTVRR